MIDNAEQAIMQMYWWYKVGCVCAGLLIVAAVTSVVSLVAIGLTVGEGSKYWPPIFKRCLFIAFPCVFLALIPALLTPSYYEVLAFAKYNIVKGGVKEFNDSEVGQLLFESLKAELEAGRRQPK